MVKWFRLRYHCPRAQVQSLVGELSSHRLCGMAKKKIKKNTTSMERKRTRLYIGSNLVRYWKIQLISTTNVPFLGNV